jgi:hypothetical protein
MKWEYQLTVHQLPNIPMDRGDVIQCDQSGLCFVHDALAGGLGWLEEVFREKGEDGWELVQTGYHRREILCIWKRNKGPKTI